MALIKNNDWSKSKFQNELNRKPNQTLGLKLNGPKNVEKKKKKKNSF